MSSESPQDRRMRELWQGQQTEGVRVSIDQIRASAGKFHRKISWRNAREYIAALAVTIFFGFQFSRTGDLLTQVGFGLLIAGMFYMAWQLHSKGSARPLPRDAGLASGIEFQRREMERQRDMLRGVWRWYLGPMIPGLAVLIAAFGRANPGRLRHPELVVGIYAIVIAAFFVLVAKLNSRAANRLQRRIDELDELGRQS